MRYKRGGLVYGDMRVNLLLMKILSVRNGRVANVC